MPSGRRRGWLRVAGAGLVVSTALAMLVWHRAVPVARRVGYWSFPPYLIVKPDGSPDGFAVAVFNEAARRRGVAITWVNAQVRRLGGGDTLPIIALTATSLPEQWADCESAGMNGFLTKPCGLDALRAEITRWIKRPSRETPTEHVA